MLWEKRGKRKGGTKINLKGGGQKRRTREIWAKEHRRKVESIQLGRRTTRSNRKLSSGRTGKRKVDVGGSGHYDATGERKSENYNVFGGLARKLSCNQTLLFGAPGRNGGVCQTLGAKRQERGGRRKEKKKGQCQGSLEKRNKRDS